MGLLPAAAHAYTVYSYSATPSMSQAGGHPNLKIEFHLEDNESNSQFQNPEIPCHCNDAKDLDVHLPAGFIGSPRLIPRCLPADFIREECPADSQVGVANPTVSIGAHLIVGPIARPIYNVEPRSNQAALLAWLTPIFNSPVYTVFSARTGTDYGLDALTDGIPQILPLVDYEQELSGVVDGIPLVQNPTSCTGPLSSTLDARSYDGTTAEATAPWPETTGCDDLSFNPSLSAQPTTTETDSPSGLEVDLSVPQELSASTPSPSEIRANTVTLPEGLTINPSAADGKTSCSEAQANLGPFASTEEAQCPEYSRIGTVSLESSALPEALPGSIYIAEPKPGDPYRIFITANGFATHVKLAGDVRPDPQTGRLTVSFPELPQSPLTEINLHFFGSEGGLLATPTRCETYAVHSTFTPWDGELAQQSATQLFSLDSGPGGSESECPAASRPLHPGFQAGPSDNTAAAHAPFAIDLIRNDGEQDLSALDVSTPPGLSATLAGIPYCPDAALKAAAEPSYSGLQEESTPSCPAASQLGTATAGAGAGDHPVYLPGRVYLAGPYKGAPLSLAVITPAVSGPYDLGNVVVRAALHVNPETAQITAVTEELPQILEGIPLRLRSILIDLNRPGFTLNPTNCDPSSVGAKVFGNEGAEASPSYPFQVANCGTLPFAPRLAMRFTGSTMRAGTPSLHATLSYPPGNGYANTGRAVITLPPTEIIDNAHINDPCTRVVFAEGSTPGEKCPPGSIIGFARAETPILEKPLEGPVYLRSSSHKLPDIVAALNGQIDIDLDGHVDTVHGAIRTSFENPPDAPVSNFTLTLDGGNKGLLQNNTNLCAHTLHVTADITGQNGKTANQNPLLQTPCRKKHHKRKQTRHSRATHVHRGGRR